MSTFRELFGAGCVLAVTILVLCIVLPRGARRTLLFMFLACGATAAIFLLFFVSAKVRPNGVVTAWQRVAPPYGPQVSVLKGPSGTRHVLVEPPYGPSISVLKAPAVTRGDELDQVPAPPLTPFDPLIFDRLIAAIDDIERERQEAVSVTMSNHDGQAALSITTSSGRHQPVDTPTVPVPCLSDGGDQGGWLWSLGTAAAIAALLYVGYLFLDAGTTGHFTWPLRILSLLAFAAMYAALAALRHKL